LYRAVGNSETIRFTADNPPAAALRSPWHLERFDGNNWTVVWKP
jgi:hypothetical protein